MTAPLPKSDPYWWEAARPAPLPEAPLPETADVAIIGAGYAGLGAAIPSICATRPISGHLRPAPRAPARIMKAARPPRWTLPRIRRPQAPCSWGPGNLRAIAMHRHHAGSAPQAIAATQRAGYGSAIS
ncbi:hypothetical protein [Mangrovicoccus ximenensis]|uniref:hypothetical protein n=1 Tax=Mangrovicoccus ximenensis TaxID=1911570 RepID=UPI0011AE65EF|nr:hypothetical protein [Mangrovicoccus ximenensis]